MRSEGAGLNATWTRSSRCRRYCSSCPNHAVAHIHAHTQRYSFSDCSFTFIVVSITAVTAGRQSSILLAANMKAYTPVYARRRHSIIRRVVSHGRELWKIRDKRLYKPSRFHCWVHQVLTPSRSNGKSNLNIFIEFTSSEILSFHCLHMLHYIEWVAQMIYYKLSSVAWNVKHENLNWSLVKKTQPIAIVSD